jgi:hypothetical protein
MIGGGYGVLGAEVLGHYVPRALDSDRGGIYVREAGVAWFCSQLTSRVSADEKLGNQLVVRLARGIVAHHFVRYAVEKEITAGRGAGSYVDTLLTNAPLHPEAEEMLADRLLCSAVVAELIDPSFSLMRGILDDVLAGSPTGKLGPSRRKVSELVAEVNCDLALSMAESAVTLGFDSQDVATYLVLEPHLPERTADLVRGALPGSTPRRSSSV